jgi:putative Holliday junction resolvase
MAEADAKNPISGPIIALDLGVKRVGIAVSDPLSISSRRLDALPRTSWKQLLRDVQHVVQRFDAQTVVIGLPLRLNGSEGDAALETRKVAEKFARSLKVPVYLQDERLTSHEAEQNLRLNGHQTDEINGLIDSEAATLILRDFLNDDQQRLRVPGS